jgi:hypothetical protein
MHGDNTVINLSDVRPKATLATWYTDSASIGLAGCNPPKWEGISSIERKGGCVGDVLIMSAGKGDRAIQKARSRKKKRISINENRDG